MKKAIMMCVLVLAVSLGAFAQQSTTEADGLRVVSTKSEVIRTGMSDRYPFKVHLSAALNPQSGEWSYSLLVGVVEMSSRAVPKGGALLIKTADGSVVELANEFDELRSRDFQGTLVPGTSLISYVNFGSYSITREQLEALKGGVQKVRLQHLGEVVESVYKKDKWGAIISAQLGELVGLMGAGDIREGF